jgi:DegV family protein with EDD domain
VIRIVTDSSSDMSSHHAAELGVTVVPMRINFGNRVYYDGVDIDRADFFRHLTKSMVLPTTEPPLPEDFQRVYGGLLRGDDQILSIHTSSRMSKTVQIAQETAKAFLGRSKITVVDSRLVSSGLELLVSLAVDAAHKGTSIDDIVRHIRGAIPHIYMVFFVDNVEYLERQSRSGRGRIFTDNLPGVKPLLIMEDGEVVPMEKVRTRGKSVDRLYEFVTEFARFNRVTILQGRPSDEAQLLLERLLEVFPDKRLDIRPYGPSLATYLGPDALGIVVQEGV